MPTNSTTDGLGFEEVNQLVTSTDVISGNRIFAAGSVQGARICDANSVIRSISLGSPGGFGAFVQAGSLATAAGSGGFLALRSPYTAAYIAVLNPQNFVAGAGSVQAYASGTKNLTSGVNVVGAASTAYDWITIGI